MTNLSYKKGYRKEREIVNDARGQGNHIISFRSSGSHSPIDCTIINTEKKSVDFIQVKNKKVYGKELEELKKLELLSGVYMVHFKLWSKNE